MSGSSSIPFVMALKTNTSSPDLETAVNHSDSATLEDKGFLFWQRNKRYILVAMGILSLSVIGYKGSAWVQHYRLHKVQKAFLRAEDSQELIAFAEANPGNPLSGVAYLTAADAEYERADHARAREHYAAAKEILKGTLLGARARLGEGVASLRSGHLETGFALLDVLSNDESAPIALRLQAAYTVALHALQTDRLERYHSQLTLLESLSARGGAFWAAKVRALEVASIPSKKRTTQEGVLSKP